jgi:cellulose synthase/poly-beta-1,6-N-acetylglucosamine synthase-like glycosyltransferase
MTVITATWQRHELLLTRCAPSVQAQRYPWVEHVIVSDGPDENLRDFLAKGSGAGHRVRYDELPAHDSEPHYGWRAQLRGLELATGEYITYCDDDDSLRPDHCSLMAAALDASPDAGFAVSRMTCHAPAGDSVIGWGPLAFGNFGAPMLAHRHGTTLYGTWRQVGLGEDWDLVERWLAAGVRCANVDAETADVYPSRFREEAG